VRDHQDLRISPAGTAEGCLGLHRGPFPAVPAGLNLEMEFLHTLRAGLDWPLLGGSQVSNARPGAPLHVSTTWY
jgi:hypothetical protein